MNLDRVLVGETRVATEDIDELIKYLEEMLALEKDVYREGSYGSRAKYRDLIRLFRDKFYKFVGDLKKEVDVLKADLVLINREIKLDSVNAKLRAWESKHGGGVYLGFSKRFEGLREKYKTDANKVIGLHEKQKQQITKAG